MTFTVLFNQIIAASMSIKHFKSIKNLTDPKLLKASVSNYDIL